MSTETGDRLQDEVARRGPWFHNLWLPDGTQTAPDHFLGDFPRWKWAQIAPHVPADLRGWTALDIGCNAGFYSFELARRGARVTAIDVNEHYLRQARWAAALLGLDNRVEFHHAQIYDLARWDRQFDLVWFMGVFYHLRYPALGLDIAGQLARRLMIFQTMTVPGEEERLNTDGLTLDQRREMLDPGWPRMAFIEHRLQDDPTNWWAPNHACVQAMLRSAGFSVRGRIADEIYLCEPNRDQPSCINTWNRDEYRSATGRSE